MEKLKLELLFGTNLKRYENCDCNEFGISDIKFDSYQKTPAISIFLKHYKITGQIIIDFKNVWANTVIEEFNVFFHEEDQWIKFLFLGLAQNSGYKKMLESYTLLGTQLQCNPTIKLFHFRVFTQNLFVDVLTQNMPAIHIIE